MEPTTTPAPATPETAAPAPAPQKPKKKSWLRRLLAVFGILCLLGVLAVASTPLWLGPAIRQALTVTMPKVLKADISVGELSVNPFAGSLRLKKFVVGNPKDNSDGFVYKTPYVFSVDEVRVNIGLLSLLSDCYVVEEVYVDKPETYYETGGPAGSNVKQLIANANAALGVKEPKEEPKKEASSSPSLQKPAVLDHKMRLEKMDILGTQASAKLGMLPAVSVPVGDITRANEEGTVQQVVLGGALDSVNFFEKLDLGGAGKKIEEAGSALKGAGESVGGALKSLFGGDKAEEKK